MTDLADAIIMGLERKLAAAETRLQDYLNIAKLSDAEADEYSVRLAKADPEAFGAFQLRHEREIIDLHSKLTAAERDLRTLSLHMGEVCVERDTAQAHIVELERDLAAANARAAKLEVVLEPFAVFAKARDESSLYGSGAPDDVVLVYAERWYEIPHYKITLGDCRAARAALDGQAETGSGNNASPT